MTCPEYDSFAEFYDSVVPYRERPDIGFYLEEVAKADGPVLELGCGTGRVLLPIAREGTPIVGLDRSGEMLAICRQKLNQESSETRAHVTLLHADMRAFGLQKRFGLITVPFRAFQHLLRVEDQLQALSEIRSHLLPGGRLILDLFNPALHFLVDASFAVHPVVEPPFTQPDGSTVVRSHRIVARDLHTQVQDVEMSYDITRVDGTQSVRSVRFKLRYLFRFEVEHLLERSGFRVEALYADYDRKPYGSVYPGELIFVATGM